VPSIPLSISGPVAPSLLCALGGLCAGVFARTHKVESRPIKSDQDKIRANQGNSGIKEFELCAGKLKLRRGRARSERLDFEFDLNYKL
jgi:hypothetical protein